MRSVATDCSSSREASGSAVSAAIEVKSGRTIALDLTVSDGAARLLVDVIAESAGEVMTWDIPGAPGGGLSVRMVSADDGAILPAFRHGCDTDTVPDLDRH